MCLLKQLRGLNFPKVVHIPCKMQRKFHNVMPFYIQLSLKQQKVLLSKPRKIKQGTKENTFISNLGNNFLPQHGQHSEPEPHGSGAHHICQRTRKCQHITGDSERERLSWLFCLWTHRSYPVECILCIKLHKRTPRSVSSNRTFDKH